MKVTVSVPGKIHLMGEHAVVHGAPALLAAINRRMYVTALIDKHSGTDGPIRIYTDEPDAYVRHIIRVIQNAFGIHVLPHLTITIRSDIPSGYHLGSSAATAVGVVAALSYLLKKIWNPERINELAYEAEKLQHGNPSGGDNTVVTFGGLVWYRRELEFLKSMWQLPYKPSAVLSHFYLVDTGRPLESTGEMVAQLGERVKRFPNKYQQVFHHNEIQTKRIAQALKQGDEHELIDAIKCGHTTLEDMDVVSKLASSVVNQVEVSGGAGKILGGGGKKAGAGYLLVYHTDASKLTGALQSFSATPIAIRLGEEGVRLERE